MSFIMLFKWLGDCLHCVNRDVDTRKGVVHVGEETHEEASAVVILASDIPPAL